MLVVFPPIFVADTIIIYGYNFVAPLAHGIKSLHGISFFWKTLKFFNSKLSFSIAHILNNN